MLCSDRFHHMTKKPVFVLCHNYTSNTWFLLPPIRKLLEAAMNFLLCLEIFQKKIIGLMTLKMLFYPLINCCRLSGLLVHWCCQPTMSVAKTTTGWVSEQCFTSPPTQYRLYGRRFVQVKRPNQQYQSTEGRSRPSKDKENNENN